MAHLTALPTRAAALAARSLRAATPTLASPRLAPTLSGAPTLALATARPLQPAASFASSAVGPQWDDALVPRSWKSRWRRGDPGLRPDDILSRAAVQNLMRHGKRTKALRVYMDAIKSLKAQWKREDAVAAPTQLGLGGKGSLPTDNRVELAAVAMERSMPALETKGVRVGANRVLVPKVLSSHRSRFLGLSNLRNAARNHLKKLREEKPKTPPVGRGGHMSRWLAREWRETLLGQSAALQKRDDLHRLAEANRAYTHYKWW